MSDGASRRWQEDESERATRRKTNQENDFSPMLPEVVRVRDFRTETHDTFTLTLDAGRLREMPYSFLPGQFNMLYVFGLGEVPISMSGDPAERGQVLHTIRAVGSVTHALAQASARRRHRHARPVRQRLAHWKRPGARRGDCRGRHRPGPVAAGDLSLLAAPRRLRPSRLALRRPHARRLALCREELQAWQQRGDFQVLVTVDRADPSWHDSIGLVTALFTQAEFDPQRRSA